ncbi:MULTISPECIES: formate/nitrite transporter family protein [unclassified Adlercreutzia]|uniref:formate/nitrite transporter family protein n=1 Tax=unclassified Adlercreutzia TaxID=2636013 RepID=UPI0013EB2A84|nr:MULTISPECIES: formate/nitrite transporter family protein [unclassified Adlercreutzia]
MPIYTPKEITDNYVKACPVKATSPVWRLLVLAIFAGVLVGLGAVASSTAAQNIPDTGMVRLVTAAAFPIGLIMIVLLGAELFTGNALMVTAAISGEITWASLLRNWAVVYVGNFIGAVGLAALMAFFGQLDIGGGTLAVYSAKIAASKCALPWMNAFVLGIFCNLLVCVAIYLGNTAHDTAGKVLGVFFPIFGFVLAGFEHCVANMYYIPVGIFANMGAYASAIADAGINTAVLNFGTFITANLIPVTLGNIIGGVLVGLVMYAAHGTRQKCDRD